MRFLALILLSLASTLIHAAPNHLVGIKCNQRTDRLIVYYYDSEDDEYLSHRRGPNEWTEGDFFGPSDGDSRGEMREMARTCVLSHGNYTVRITPVEENPNVNGECGAVVTFMVDILRGKEWILVRHRLDSAFCSNPTGVTTTRIVVDGRSREPRLTTIPSP
jgi:hypothetical protein